MLMISISLTIGVFKFKVVSDQFCHHVSNIFQGYSEKYTQHQTNLHMPDAYRQFAQREYHYSAYQLGKKNISSVAIAKLTVGYIIHVGITYLITVM